MFSHPAVDGFMMWGFWDKAHWMNNAPLFNATWGAKPGLLHWNNLLFKEWWSNLDGVTGNDGKVMFTVFKGAHNVTVVVGNDTITKQVWVGDDGGSVTIHV